VSDVKPALTEREWSTLGFRRVVDEENNDLQAAKIEDGNVYREHDENVDEWQRLEHPHAMAALCLYGQSFGFTREDIELLNEVSESANSVYPLELDEAQTEHLRSLINRIAALLPPSDSTRAQDE
jgi:hypothetical protein